MYLVKRTKIKHFRCLNWLKRICFRKKQSPFSKKTVNSQAKKVLIMIKSYRLLNNLIGWFLFIVASIVYISTVEPTTSFWDCGQYIATSYKLQIGHPPGAPTFQIFARVFSLLSFGDVERVAFVINSFSAIASAFTIMFLFWTITMFAKKLVINNDNSISLTQKLSVFGAGFIGALAYTFTDTFWFSAVETEVYALSSLMTAITFWAILKWESQSEKEGAEKWILFIAYIVGLSIGIHLLNLLALPAIVYVYYFKKYKFSKKSFIKAGVLGLSLLGIILYILIPGIVVLAGNFELFFVNVLRLPFNSGTVIYFALFLGLIIWAIRYSIIHKKQILNLALKSLVFLLIGYSTYFSLVIRSNANPPIDQNNPSNALNLLSYLRREQYGDTPLLYGPFYSAPFAPSEKWGDRSPVYAKNYETKRYEVINTRENTKPAYDPEFTTVFPRMWNGTEQHFIEGYERWGDVTGVKVRHQGQRGEVELITKPTFLENLRYFFSYQINHMYFRYFMWNFVGRQNDIQSHGSLTDGNWISGIQFIDNRLGNQDLYPEHMKSNKARNVYFFLPLILGIIGLYYHINSRPKDAFIIGLLFFMTGLAIVIFLNQTPYQPRERDYAYAASFYAFAVWLGLGVIGIFNFINKYLKKSIASILIAVIISGLAAPYILAKENWDDHDRSNRYTARDIAKNYLNSCSPNAILFSNGDNDTFPLWYVQEVEGYRTDVRVVNLSLLSTDWYANAKKRKVYNADPVPFSLQSHQFQSGTLDVVYLIEQNENQEAVNIIDLFKVLREQPDRLKRRFGTSEIEFFPSKNFYLPIDSAYMVDNGIVPRELADQIVDRMEWRIDRNVLYKNGILVLDLIASNNWKRPIYFCITAGDDSYFGLQDYFQLEGLTYKLVPIKTPNRQGFTGRIDSDILYKNMVEEFYWGNMYKPGVYLDETNRKMIMNFRNNFARLAEQLILEGDTARAIKTLDKAMEKMPEHNVPFNFFVIPIADAYYSAKQIEKADSILQRMIDIETENLKFYFGLKGSAAASVSQDRERSLFVLSRIVQVLEKYQRTEMFKKTDAIFQEYFQIWQNSR